MAAQQSPRLNLQTPKVGQFFTHPDRRKGNNHRVKQIFDQVMIEAYYRCITGLKNPTWLNRSYDTVTKAWDHVRQTPIKFKGGDSLPFETVFQIFDPIGYRTLLQILSHERTEQQTYKRALFEEYLVNLHDNA